MPDLVPVVVATCPLNRPDLIAWTPGMWLHVDFERDRYVGIVWKERDHA